jgi:hypothetical protein
MKISNKIRYHYRLVCSKSEYLRDGGNGLHISWIFLISYFSWIFTSRGVGSMMHMYFQFYFYLKKFGNILTTCIVYFQIFITIYFNRFIVSNIQTFLKWSSMEIKSLYILCYQIQNCMTSVVTVLLNTCPFFWKRAGGAYFGTTKNTHMHIVQKASSLLF